MRRLRIPGERLIFSRAVCVFREKGSFSAAPPRVPGGKAKRRRKKHGRLFSDKPVGKGAKRGAASFRYFLAQKKERPFSGAFLLLFFVFRAGEPPISTVFRVGGLPLSK